MNVLQILPSLDIGGVETGTVDLARYLTKNGHKAITVSGGGRLVRELDMPLSRHYTLPVGKKSPITIIRMIHALRDIIRKEDIDIVHARSRVPALTAYIACKITNRPFVTTAHGYYKKHLLSEPMGWGKFVIVASHVMAKHMAGAFNVPYDRLKLIPRGVDLKRFILRSAKNRQGQEFTIGMVSRITPLKGHADFIMAVSILSRQIPRLKAVIVGDAPKYKYREDLELLVRRLGLQGTVTFIKGTEEVPAVMGSLDVLVSATITPEAFGRVIIEAQAIGVPVVATEVGGVIDIVEDRKTGLLCRPRDHKDMADKIMSIYKDKALCEAMVAAARVRVETDFGADMMMQRTIAVYDQAIKQQNILVIKISALGDVILAVPSLRALRMKYPGAVIKVLVGVDAREVLVACPYINDVIVCDFGGTHRGIKGLLNLARELRRGCFDVLFDLQNNRKSHALAALSMAPLRYGYDNKKWSFLLNRRIKDDAPYLDPVEHQFRTLKSAGIKTTDKRLELWPSVEDVKAADKFLADNWVNAAQGLVGIHVRASARWTTKNWPASYIADLCDAIAREYGARVVLTGSPSDEKFAQAIAAKTKSKPIIAAGKTGILELASLIRRFRVFLTPDSAPMHIASAVGTPVIALFGPTAPQRHMAPSDNSLPISKAAGMGCGPCYKPDCRKKVTCMKKISVDEVFEAMRKYIEKGEEVKV